MIRVLVADDEALVRAGLSRLLASEPDIEPVGEAVDGLAAVEAARRRQPDVVLMDIRMPRLDGIEATRRVLECSPRTRVVVLTTYDLDEYVFDALRAGASGFLLKDTEPDRLLEGIRLVVSGEGLLSPASTRRLIAEFARVAGPPSRASADGLDELTPRELEVLRLIALGRSNSEIAKDLVVGAATVKTHVRRVLMKIGARDRAQAIVAAYRAGVVRPGDAR